MNKILFFNNLKTLLVCLVVIAHVACMYIPLSFLEIFNCPEIPGMGSFLLVIRTFVMSLFFFISGFFVPGSYDKYGANLFLKKKIIRLGIPIILLMPWGYGHLWYLGNLLLLCFLYCIKRKYVQTHMFTQSKIPSLLILLLAGLLVGIVCSVLRYLYVPGYWIQPIFLFKFEPIHTPQYILLFCLGILSYRFNWINQISDRNAYIAFLISIFLIIIAILYNGFSKNDTIYHWSYGLYESIICVFFDYGILWLFRKHCNKSNAFLDWCSDHSFAVHIVHVEILCSIVVYCQNIVPYAYLQFGIVLILTMIISLLFSFILKLIPGLNKIL